MSEEFLNFGLHPDIMRAIEERGYEIPTDVQKQIIPMMMEANDVLAQSQTGTGKTAAFALPILNLTQAKIGFVQCLILAPTRELVMQVAEIIEEYGKYTHHKVLSIYGGSSYDRQIKALRKGVDIVVGTPGRLLDLINKKALKLSQVHHLVLDEADEMLSMGFIDDVETIMSEIKGQHQTALFSATLPKRIVELAEKYMVNPTTVKVKAAHLTVDKIDQRYYMVNQKDKISALTRLFEVEEITRALIFTKTRKSTGEVANELTQRGYPAEAINGDLTQDARIQVLKRFRNDQITVLVATDVAARGLDIQDISHVINFDLPYEEEYYVHRIGRTGRAGKEGIAISIITPAEEFRVRRLQRFTKADITKHVLPTKDEIIEYRNNILMHDLEKWLIRDRCKQELVMVEALMEGGHDPMKIAAVALKMARAKERQRPIWEISALKPPRSKSGRNSRNDRRGGNRDRNSGGNRDRSGGDRSKRRAASKVSHEAGMVRISMNIGKNQQIRPRDIVGTLAYQADIPGSEIGKIFIENKSSLVDIPEKYLTRVISKSGEMKIRKFTIDVKNA